MSLTQVTALSFTLTIVMTGCDGVSVSDVTVEATDVVTNEPVRGARVTFVADERPVSIPDDELLTVEEVLEQYGADVGVTDEDGHFQISTVDWSSPFDCMDAFAPNHWLFRIETEDSSEMLVLAPASREVTGLPDFAEAAVQGNTFALRVINIECGGPLPDDGMPEYVHRRE